MHNLGTIGFAAAYVFVGLIVLFVPPLLTTASVPRATGHFEEYRDGVGIFLAKVDGAPPPGKLVFFAYMAFPGGSSNILGQGKWSVVSVFGYGCVPDGKCQSIADGRVWIDALDAPPRHNTSQASMKSN